MSSTREHFVLHFTKLRRDIGKTFKSDIHKEQALLKLAECEMWLDQNDGMRGARISVARRCLEEDVRPV
jgi:hypothetical protein